MNKFTKAIAAIMLVVAAIIVAGCNKPDEPNNGGGNNNGGNGNNNGGNDNAIPEGAIKGEFTINDNGDQVYFSKGNLQYQASSNTWRFAENQYDLLITSEDMTNLDDFGNMYADASLQYSSTNNDWIDLFGWGTSGYNHGAICYQPWSTSILAGDYYAYGDCLNNLYDRSGQADWSYNAISNGGNQENLCWRTLTKAEWVYLFESRNTSSGIRFVKAQVNGVDGVILLPDDWSSDTYNLMGTNDGWASFSSNLISTSQWAMLENAGVVFLPASGSRFGTMVYVGGGGYYWSASCTGNKAAYGLVFSGYLSTSQCCDLRDGFSVRLVCRSEH